jgi:hypothetical protein
MLGGLGRGRGAEILSPTTPLFSVKLTKTARMSTTMPPDGEIVLLTYLMEGQEVAVLQLPATGFKAPQRATYV